MKAKDERADDLACEIVYNNNWGIFLTMINRKMPGIEVMVLMNHMTRSSMIEVMGEDRVMYAMDYPYEYVADEVRAMDNLAITDAQKKKFFQTNAERWFKL